MNNIEINIKHTLFKLEPDFVELQVYFIVDNVFPILSHISMIAGSCGGRLKDPHLHLDPHITSPTERHSFPYLANL
jgi:hypothetical protein